MCFTRYIFQKMELYVYLLQLLTYVSNIPHTWKLFDIIFFHIFSLFQWNDVSPNPPINTIRFKHIRIFCYRFMETLLLLTCISNSNLLLRMMLKKWRKFYSKKNWKRCFLISFHILGGKCFRIFSLLTCRSLQILDALVKFLISMFHE